MADVVALLDSGALLKLKAPLKIHSRALDGPPSVQGGDVRFADLPFRKAPSSFQRSPVNRIICMCLRRA